jgi:hypothetical protein
MLTEIFKLNSGVYNLISSDTSKHRRECEKCWSLLKLGEEFGGMHYINSIISLKFGDNPLIWNITFIMNQN